jgi:hypothetical protein
MADIAKSFFQFINEWDESRLRRYDTPGDKGRHWVLNLRVGLDWAWNSTPDSTLDQISESLSRIGRVIPEEIEVHGEFDDGTQWSAPIPQQEFIGWDDVEEGDEEDPYLEYSFQGAAQVMFWSEYDRESLQRFIEEDRDLLAIHEGSYTLATETDFDEELIQFMKSISTEEPEPETLDQDEIYNRIIDAWKSGGEAAAEAVRKKYLGESAIASYDQWSQLNLGLRLF